MKHQILNYSKKQQNSTEVFLIEISNVNNIYTEAYSGLSNRFSGKTEADNEITYLFS